MSEYQRPSQRYSAKLSDKNKGRSSHVRKRSSLNSKPGQHGMTGSYGFMGLSTNMSDEYEDLTSSLYGYHPDYGARLREHELIYRDKIWIFIFIIHVIIMLTIGINFTFVGLPQARIEAMRLIDEGIVTGSPTMEPTKMTIQPTIMTMEPTIVGQTYAPTLMTLIPTKSEFIIPEDFGEVSADDILQLEPRGLFITLIVQCFVGAVFGLLILQLIKYTNKYIIQIMLFLTTAMFLTLIVFGSIINFTLLIYVGLGGIFISGIYTYCVWPQIPFACVLLQISTKIIKTYPRSILISFFMIPLNFIWYTIWSMAAGGYGLWYVQTKSNLNNGSKGTPLIISSSSPGAALTLAVIFLISYYWGIQVNKTISKISGMGIAIRFYHTPNKRRLAKIKIEVQQRLTLEDKTTVDEEKQKMDEIIQEELKKQQKTKVRSKSKTQNDLVSMVETIQLNHGKSDDDNRTIKSSKSSEYTTNTIDSIDGKTQFKATVYSIKYSITHGIGSVFFGAFIIPFITFYKSIMKAGSVMTATAWCAKPQLNFFNNLSYWFNNYGYVYCSMYNIDLISGCQDVYNLIHNSGFEKIINDDLSGFLVYSVSFLSFCVSCIVGYIVGNIYYKEQQNILYYIALLGGLYGYYICYSILVIIQSCVTTLFICFIEDTKSFKFNRDKQYNKFVGSREEIATFIQTGYTQPKKQLEA